MTDPSTVAPVTPSTWDCFAPGCFAGQVTLVTGAAGGMGREVARAFQQLGAQVWLTDLDADALTAVAGELTAPDAPAPVVWPVDVADPAAVAAMYREIDARHGRVDNVVSCAAVITAESSLTMTPEHWERVLRINLVGTFTVLQEAVRRMTVQRSGHIVAVASDAGKRGGGGLVADAAYAASKAGVLSVVKSLAREFAGTGVRVNALTPGPTDTPMHSGLSTELKERIAADLPVGRMGHPSDMAAAALFLCSPAANFVYGASLNVDGGAMFE